MDLEVGLDPPLPLDEVEILLELPRYLVRETQLPPDVRTTEDRPDAVQIPLTGAAVQITAIPFASGSRTGVGCCCPCKRPWEDRDLYVRQLHQGLEVGRVTWRLTLEQSDRRRRIRLQPGSQRGRPRLVGRIRRLLGARPAAC
jgi:hypothetical protein